MDQFSGLPRAILLSISALSGEMYGDIDGGELKAELSRREFSPEEPALLGAMRALKDAGYLDCYFLGGNGVTMIHLKHAGRQEVEGWPTSPGSLSAGDVEYLVSVLQAHGEDSDVSETERGMARAAATAFRDLGVGVTAEIMATWLKHLGVG